jgi:hypothetical protein
MEFKGISLDGVVQEIDREASFADLDVRNGNYIYNVKKEAYEDTLEDMEGASGIVHGMPSWKSLAEIDLERARYLLSADDMLEETLAKHRVR